MSIIQADSQQMSSMIREIADSLQSCILNPRTAAFIGIYTHGVPLAQRLKKLFDSQNQTQCPFGTLDINLYRDDYDLRGVRPRIQSSEIRFSIDNREVILVDDVLYTGRTIRAAIEALGDYGRPNAIRLAVLVDRGHRELPIQADACGMVIPTDKKDRIRVRMSELDGVDEILLVPGEH